MFSKLIHLQPPQLGVNYYCLVGKSTLPTLVTKGQKMSWKKIAIKECTEIVYQLLKTTYKQLDWAFIVSQNSYLTELLLMLSARLTRKPDALHTHFHRPVDVLDTLPPHYH